jgi:hypothetical protein
MYVWNGFMTITSCERDSTVCKISELNKDVECKKCVS